MYVDDERPTEGVSPSEDVPPARKIIALQNKEYEESANRQKKK